MNSEKQRSEFVATRHGLSRQVAVMPREEMEAYEAFIYQLVDTFAPETAVELQLAQSWAAFQWRINRAVALEETLFTLGNIEQVAENLNIEHAQAHNAASNAKFFRNQATEFAKISMHSQRLVNQAERTLKQLLHLQAVRKERQQSELGDAVSVYKLQRMQGLPFDPKAHGFIVTLDQVEASMERGIAITQSIRAEELNWNLNEFEKEFGRAA